MIPEPITEKARKLARLAADAAATPAERAVAAEKLRRFMKQHGVTEDEITGIGATEFSFDAVDPKSRAKNRRDKDLSALANQIIGYVTGWRETCRVFEHTNFKLKTKHFSVMAKLTISERADFIAAWHHYLPLFLTARKKLRAAAKKACSGFIQQMDLGKPSDGPDKPMTASELDALRSAMRSVDGDPWQRPAGNIGQGTLSLQ